MRGVALVVMGLLDGHDGGRGRRDCRPANRENNMMSLDDRLRCQPIVETCTTTGQSSVS